MKAIEYLRQIKKLDKIIENKLIEKDQWKAIATGITARAEGERVQSSGSKQKMADAVCRYLSIDEEIDKYIDQLVELKMQVISDIEKLPINEYDVLHMVYIQGFELGDVAKSKKEDYSNITTIHGRALKHLQNIIDDRKESVENV